MCDENFENIEYTIKHCVHFLEELYFIHDRKTFIKYIFPYLDTSTFEDITPYQYSCHSAGLISEEKREEIREIFTGLVRSIRLSQRKNYYKSKYKLLR